MFKCVDTMLSKIKANITHETLVELRNAPLYGSAELLSSSLITTMAKKLSHVLQYEISRKAVTVEKKFSQPVKQSPQGLQGIFHEMVRCSLDLLNIFV